MEVHQVRKLADLTRPGRPQPAWAQLMAKMRRKTLIVCTPCHQAIHARATSRDTHGNSHWRATCSETGPPVRTGGRWKRTRPSGHLASGLPERSPAQPITTVTIAPPGTNLRCTRGLPGPGTVTLTAAVCPAASVPDIGVTTTLFFRPAGSDTDQFTAPPGMQSA